MTIAPMRAPTSGRGSSRESRDRRANRSSAAGGGGAGLVSRVGLMKTSGSWRVPAGAAPRPGRLLPGAGRRELADEFHVGLVDQVRPGQRRLATAEHVAVRLVEPQPVDRRIPLQVWLLVDGPLQSAGLDLRRD